MATPLPPLRRATLPLLVFVLVGVLASTARADLVVSRADRRVDLTSHIVRVLASLKVENVGSDSVSQVLLAFPNIQAKNLAAIRAFGTEGKVKGQSIIMPIEVVQPSGAPPELTFFSALFPKPLEKGKTLHLDVLTVFTHSLQPFPEEITQAEAQLVVYQDSAHYLSPYPVKVQTLTIRLPGGRVESYTRLPNAKLVDFELKYGPFEDLPPFSYSPVIVHFENNNPFAVSKEVIREIGISHWGNVQITEHYSISHGGARLKGEFSRIDYQSRPYVRGVSSFRHLIARLPPRAHSIYYRDEIGNISTSHLWSDSKKTQLEIEPRFPLFGGWQTTFTVGYGLPLQDFVFYSDGKRFLNITFGSPMEEILIEKLIVKVVLPEGSKDIEVSAPFPTKQWQEVKYSHLDIVGRPVVILEKPDVIPEHNLYFQVYYRFNNISLLREPLMLITGFFLLFVACIVYMRTDMSISKNSPYLAKLQWDDVQVTVQKIQGIFEQCLAVRDKLEASLRDLSRTGDIQSCKAARKAADAQFKELSKELKPLLTSLHSSPQSNQVEDLIAKEREMQEKLMARHSTVVDSFEKTCGQKGSGRRSDPKRSKKTQPAAPASTSKDSPAGGRWWEGADVRLRCRSFHLRALPVASPTRGPTMRAEATQISAFTATVAHVLCFAGLAAAHSLASCGALVSDPALALRLLVVFEAPIVIAVFSYLRRDPQSCSFIKAAARGLLGLPVGTFLNALGAIILGAPVGIKYCIVTIYWSLLMSLFTFVPAACVFGASKIDWQNVLSHSIYFTSTDVENYMISAPCHGAVIGAWLGAWPMPLDWERPWQEWPICVTYGAVAGHLIGMVMSLVLIDVHKRRVCAKAD